MYVNNSITHFYATKIDVQIRIKQTQLTEKRVNYFESTKFFQAFPEFGIYEVFNLQMSTFIVDMYLTCPFSTLSCLLSEYTGSPKVINKGLSSIRKNIAANDNGKKLI